MSARLFITVVCASIACARLSPEPVVPDATPSVTYESLPPCSEEPVVTPTDTTGTLTAPQLLNREQVAAFVRNIYPPQLRDRGMGGTPAIWLSVGTDGCVKEMFLGRSGGHELLDEAAMLAGRLMRFEPARRNERAISVWIEVPIQFAVGRRNR